MPLATINEDIMIKYENYGEEDFFFFFFFSEREMMMMMMLNSVDR